MRGVLLILSYGDRAWRPFGPPCRSALGNATKEARAPIWGQGRSELTLRFVEVHTMAEVYCVKCKAKREAIDTKKVTMKNGKPALEGKCPVCGTKVFRIGG